MHIQVIFDENAAFCLLLSDVKNYSVHIFAYIMINSMINCMRLLITIIQLPNDLMQFVIFFL